MLLRTTAVSSERRTFIVVIERAPNTETNIAERMKYLVLRAHCTMYMCIQYLNQEKDTTNKLTCALFTFYYKPFCATEAIEQKQ